MNEAVVGIILMAIGIVGTIFVCRCRPNGRAGSGTGSNTDPVRDGIERAGGNNKRLEDAERATSGRLEEQAETIERAGRDNQGAQQLVQKAKHILHSARHTD